MCELCGEQPVSVLCAECCRCYCDECNKLIHGIKSKKGHKVEAIPEGVVVNAMCPLHGDALRMFCVDEVKLCCLTCKTKELHKGHNVVELSAISQDNETFSAAAVKKRFADVLKCDDALDKKIEEAIENIQKRHAQEKLVEEEGRKGRKMMEEFEND